LTQTFYRDQKKNQPHEKSHQTDPVISGSIDHQQKRIRQARTGNSDNQTFVSTRAGPNVLNRLTAAFIPSTPRFSIRTP
jgi:hypothetical protein